MTLIDLGTIDLGKKGQGEINLGVIDFGGGWTPHGPDFNQDFNQDFLIGTTTD